jgi:hypothetical protein
MKKVEDASGAKYAIHNEKPKSSAYEAPTPVVSWKTSNLSISGDAFLNFLVCI